MAERPLFYLVVIQACEARLLRDPSALRGAGFERFGVEQALLDSLSVPEPRRGVVVGSELIAMDDPRVTEGEVPFDGVSARVVIVSPDASVSSKSMQPILPWLAAALLHEGMSLIAAPPPAADSRAERGAWEMPVAPARYVVAALVALAVGFGLGYVWHGMRQAGATVPRDIGASEAGVRIGSPVGGATVGMPPSRGRRGPDDDPDEERGQPSGAEARREPASPGLPAPPHAVEDRAAAGFGAASALAGRPDDLKPTKPRPSPAPVNPKTKDSAAARRRVAALPLLSLWRGEPTFQVSDRTCNAYGDLELNARSADAGARRIVICGLFHLESGGGAARTSVCVPSLRQCAQVSDVSGSIVPAYICTPLSGKAYGLQRGRAGGRHGHLGRLGYRKGKAGAGLLVVGGREVRGRCGRAAPYAREVRVLR